MTTFLINPYQGEPIKIIGAKKEGADSKLFILAKKFDYQAGQFVMAGWPGFGEAAFSLCAENEICVRKIGGLTAQLHRLKKGDKIFIRGPYGQGWPEVSGNLLIVTGGCGIIALRPLLKREKTVIFYGVKKKEDLLFQDEHKEWSDLHITFSPKRVTDLFGEVDLPKDLSVFLCGPPRMYESVVEKLKERQVAEENIYLSLERRMYCALGTCQHCAIGTKYVCVDGPVFNLKELKSQPF